MEETITVDEKQFILTTDVPLTAEQKEQTIAEIRRQSGCGCGSKMANLDIITLNTTGCVTVTMLAPANITIQDIKVGPTGGEVDCPSPGFACGPNPVCSNPDCNPAETADIIVIVTWGNSGDISGTFTPTLIIDTGTPIIGPSTTVPPSPDMGMTLGTATTQFPTQTGMTVARGQHTICIDSGTITSP